MEAYAVLQPWASAAMAIGPTPTIRQIAKANPGATTRVAPAAGNVIGATLWSPLAAIARCVANSLLSEHSRCNFLCHRESLAIQRIVAAFSLAAANDEAAVSDELFRRAPERDA